jgi:tetratricopeptide (TPR) repeat protein
LFERRRSYDRRRLLADAARAQRKGKLRKAIALYGRVLEVEPGNPDLHRRLAPLLARARRTAEAWESYRRAADTLVRLGFVERAIGVYREATQHLAREDRLWLALADLEMRRGRPTDAVAALRAGRAHLRSRADRPRAIRLLERARELDASHFEAGFDLVGLLLRAGQRARARALLEELALRASASELRRVRARQFRAAPGPRFAWQWLAAALGAGRRAAARGRRSPARR